MIKRTFKIGDRERILYVLKKGYYRRGRFFHCKFLPNHLTHFRFSLILSKKVSRTAVGRNLIRRRAYEAIRRNWPVSVKSCYDVVVLPGARTAKAEFSEIEKEVVFLFRNL